MKNKRNLLGSEKDPTGQHKINVSDGENHFEKLNYLRKKTKRKSIITIIIFVVLCILLSFFGKNWRFDLTPQTLMTTGEVTRGLLNRLQEDVEIVVLDSRANFAEYNSFVVPLLDDYVMQGQDHLDVRYVDIQNNPDIIRELDPENQYQLRGGQVVVRSDKRLRVLTQEDFLQMALDPLTGEAVYNGFKAESSLSGAIRFVSDPTIPKIYFAEGHGEKDLSDGFVELRLMLNGQGYGIEKIQTLTEDIPEDAAALVLLGPDFDISPVEVAKFNNYVSTGGSLFVAVDYHSGSYQNLNEVLSLFNLVLTDDRVEETTEKLIYREKMDQFLAQVPSSRVIEQAYPNSVLTANSRAVTIGSSPAEWIGTEALVTTDDQGRLTNNAEVVGEIGVQNVAMVAENSGVVTSPDMPSAKAIVFGGTAILSDEILYQLGESGLNYQLIFHSFNWLTNQVGSSNELIIPVKPVVDYNITNLERTPITVASVVAVIVIPLILFLVARRVAKRRLHM